MLIQVVNKFDALPEDLDEESIFVPFFIKEDDKKHVWDSTMKLLRGNPDTLQFVQNYFDTEMPTKMHYPANYEQTNSFQVRSTGLGLSISRLISKALKGDCGLHFDKNRKIANYWVLLPVVNDQCTRTDLDLDFASSVV